MVDVDTLSIDPATHGTACALWRTPYPAPGAGYLTKAGYARSSIKDTKVDIVERAVASAAAAVRWIEESYVPRDAIKLVIVELPQVYQRGGGVKKAKSKGDPNKVVLPLAMVDAAVRALLPMAKAISYKPHDWKGDIGKPVAGDGDMPDIGMEGEAEYIITTRVKARLEVFELPTVDWTTSKKLSWDVADAIGVGLHHFGRFDRKRVYPRE